MALIRPATAADGPAIDAVHRHAFPTDAEARLVALLIARGKDAVSLVAEERGQVAGHILFSPATMKWPNHPTCPGLGLAPLAVLPRFQRQGIGSALMRAGLAEYRQHGGFVVVIGHPAYYPRFGFVPASRYGMTCDFGSGDAFQVIVDHEVRLPFGGAAVRYADEFYELFAPPA
jgi:putative acetyltransferase